MAFPAHVALLMTCSGFVMFVTSRTAATVCDISPLVMRHQAAKKCAGGGAAEKAAETQAPRLGCFGLKAQHHDQGHQSCDRSTEFLPTSEIKCLRRSDANHGPDLS
jgi:hypothetical protein